MKQFRWVIISVLLLVMSSMLPLASTESVKAGTGNSSLEGLTNGADSIIVGTVVERSSYWNDEHTGIYTSVVLSVEERLKGTASQDKITVTLPGGEAEGIGEWVSDTPSFEQGEKAVVFLKKLSKEQIPKVKDSKLQLSEEQFDVYYGFRGKFTIKGEKVGNLPVAQFKERVGKVLKGQTLTDEELEVPLSPVISPYSYEGMKWPGSSPIVSFRINENTADCTGEGAAVQAAAATWGAAGAYFSFAYAGTTTVTDVSSYDGVNEILWTNLGSGNTLAQTTTWYIPSTLTIFECDMEFNDYKTWSTSVQYDVQTVALHEFGHYLRLVHSSDINAVMYYLYQGMRRALYSDDIAGIQSIYGALPIAPTVTNSGASNIAQTSARLNGEVTSTGGANPTVHIYWGPSDGGTTPGSWAHDVNLGTKAAGAFYTDISSLTGSTTYYYRCYAVNAAGSDWADATSSFTTNAPPTPPTVTNSTGAGSITDTAARLSGELTSTGGVSTTVRIYWGPSDGGTTPGSWAHDVNLGAKAAGAFYTDISSLTASTPYYYRCYATNSAGSDWADATATFTTTATPVKLLGMDDAATATGAAANYIVMDRFAAVTSGNISQIRVKCTVAGSVKVALYADSSGNPGSLLVANNAGASVTSGWNTINLPSPTSVTAGTYYWIAFNSSPSCVCYAPATGALLYRALAYSSDFPASAGTGFATLADYHCLTAGWGTVVINAPTVTNSTGASSITDTGARLNGELTSTGGASTTVHIYWGPSDGGTTPGSWAHDVNLGAKAAGAFYTDISGLTGSTPYYYRCYATNAAGSDWADATASFPTSAPPTPPTVTNSTGADSITETTARLSGELTSTGGASTTVRIYWGPTDGGTTPGSWANVDYLGTNSTGTFYAGISGLTASTPYYYRCYATNAAGDDWADATASFTTSSPPVKLLGMDDAAIAGGVTANYLVMDRFAAVASGNITQIRVKCNAAGSVKVALYADSSGSPGSLLVANNTGASVVSGWNTINLPSPTAVTAGTYYWIAFNSSSQCASYASAGGGALLYKSLAYANSFPASAGTGFATLSPYHSLTAGWGTAELPPPPSLLSPGEVIIFKWSAATGATKYWLQVNTGADFTGTNMFNAELGNVVEQEVSGFSLGATYYWRVKAGNAAGWSAWSSVRSVVANAVP